MTTTRLISYNRKAKSISIFFRIVDSKEKSPVFMSSNFLASIKVEDELKVLPFKEAFHEALFLGFFDHTVKVSPVFGTTASSPTSVFIHSANISQVAGSP
jgi:hypothetical protein